MLPKESERRKSMYKYQKSKRKYDMDLFREPYNRELCENFSDRSQYKNAFPYTRLTDFGDDELRTLREAPFGHIVDTSYNEDLDYNGYNPDMDWYR